MATDTASETGDSDREAGTRADQQQPQRIGRLPGETSPSQYMARLWEDFERELVPTRRHPQTPWREVFGSVQERIHKAAEQKLVLGKYRSADLKRIKLMRTSLQGRVSSVPSRPCV